MQEAGVLKLFNEIEMPLLEVLSDMELYGIYIDEEELTKYGLKLKDKITTLTEEIYALAKRRV